jgi:kinesin family member 2/24
LQTFGEKDDTHAVYHYTVQPLVATMFSGGGRGTCFAYGQTGSVRGVCVLSVVRRRLTFGSQGKTYTMTGIESYVARDIFRLVESAESKRFRVYVSMFEIYGGRCSDLLHDRAPVTIREDGSGKVQTLNLRPVECESEVGLLDTISRGNESRTTHATAVNEVSSRSHSICEIFVRNDAGRRVGSLSLIDLAGSERAADRSNHNRQRRLESAEINKSLLALKECIRCVRSFYRLRTCDDVFVQCDGRIWGSRSLPSVQAHPRAQGQLYRKERADLHDRSSEPLCLCR